MTVRIHPTSLVSSDAQIGEDVEIGAFAIVGPECVIGDGCLIASRATLEKLVTLGANVKVGSGSIVGGDPQDLKFRGERTFVEIGDRTVIRECVTINRGTAESERTVVGADCLVMSYVHLAHDCHLGNHIIISNASQVAGHVHMEDRVILSGLVAVHQFVKIGAYAFVGGSSKVTQDVPPYLKAAGNPVKLYGLNSVGLTRGDFDPAVVRELKRAYRLFFRSDLILSNAMERAREELHPYPEVEHFLSFVSKSERGLAV
ncbi:MAG: acyl-ACP--UDP-N-acetylglucosamine O-acyltransferase [Gemmatimonadaceae bacterium]